MKPINILRMRKAAVGVSDPYFSSVVGLWPFDEANGATSFTDYSSKGRTFTRTGTPTGSNSVAKFGSTSLNVPGSNWSYLLTDNSTDLSLTGDFTVEGWAYATSQTKSYMGILSRAGPDTTNGGVQLMRLSGLLYLTIWDATPRSIVGPTFSLGTWYHVAFERSGTTIYLYVNGTVVSSTLTSSGTEFGGQIEIGRGNDNTADNESWNGYLQDIRITKGVARYGGTSFTAPTAFYPHS